MNSFFETIPHKVLHLLSYLQSTLLHPAHVGWLERLGGVVERFYVEDKRRAVRLRALKVLSEVTLANLVLHEERLLEACVLPHLANLEEETDRKVRVEAVELVARLAKKATGPRLGDLLDLLDKVCRLLAANPATGAANSSNLVSADCRLYTGGMVSMTVKPRQTATLWCCSREKTLTTKERLYMVLSHA